LQNQAFEQGIERQIADYSLVIGGGRSYNIHKIYGRFAVGRSTLQGSAEGVLEAGMAMTDVIAAAMPSDRSLLIVEDDKSFLQRLARAMEGRGFAVTTAESVADGLTQLESATPAFAVVDMRLEDGNGLDVISALKRRRPDARAIILTGYGNIATAVNAVKLGAVDYLSKPVDADDVVAALLALDGRKVEPPENPMSADRVRWEHIQRIYELCGRNVSETARRLNMHRRTLQRILAKRAPK
jgi:two-component system, response regulator RegA